MESSAVLRSFHCTIPHTQHSGLSGRSGKLFFSPQIRKGVFIPSTKALETTLTSAITDVNSSPPKKNGNAAVFPNGFEELVLEICDETEIAELKLKIGEFEMNLRRNIGSSITPMPVVSQSLPTAAPSQKAIESVPAASSTSVSSSKSPPKKTSPFINVSSEISAKLASLAASGSNGYVLVSSPTVGSFRTGRTVKGKKQPPVCKVGDVIKEGQIIGYLDQFGSELPLRSDVAGEVIKLLYSDGEAIGYGDPLLAVLPSFQGIKD